MTAPDPNAPDPNASDPNGPDPNDPDPNDPDRAMAALRDVHRLQHRTREEYIRQGYRWPQSVAGIAGLIACFAAFDAPEPWRRFLAPAGCAVILATIFVAQRRAPVRRKPTAGETGFTLAVVALWFAAYLPLLIGTKLLELPAPWTIAAIACVILLGAFARPLRRAHASAVHWS
ncbi:hypothetical protein [Actinomadura sp. WMMB 499]|uniref:hypothetical protein n=1 Tax=Actinomadura sp. WMMB 499 TaxID=1219491 RepID=UPI0012468ED6|nr:hypothetical protein [Actinomadura sp. WMMB 499]QFG22702.1 hypothetical protein F7P10_17830 [Actinomadura sp. WMMB 499]